MNKLSDISVIYDGDCPLCKDFVAMMRLKEIFKKVSLISAREDNKLVIEAKGRGLNLEKGMLVIIDGEYYYGSDAVWVMSLMTSGDSLGQRLTKVILGQRWLAKLLYPIMRLGRKIILFFIGKGSI